MWHFTLAWVGTGFCGPEGGTDLRLRTKGATRTRPLLTLPKQPCLLLRQKSSQWRFLHFIDLLSGSAANLSNSTNILLDSDTVVAAACPLQSTTSPFWLCLTKQVNKLYSDELWLLHLQAALSQRLCCPRCEQGELLWPGLVGRQQQGWGAAPGAEWNHCLLPGQATDPEPSLDVCWHCRLCCTVKIDYLSIWEKSLWQVYLIFLLETIQLLEYLDLFEWKYYRNILSSGFLRGEEISFCSQNFVKGSQPPSQYWKTVGTLPVIEWKASKEINPPQPMMEGPSTLMLPKAGATFWALSPWKKPWEGAASSPGPALGLGGGQDRHKR